MGVATTLCLSPVVCCENIGHVENLCTPVWNISLSYRRRSSCITKSTRSNQMACLGPDGKLVLPSPLQNTMQHRHLTRDRTKYIEEGRRAKSETPPYLVFMVKETGNDEWAGVGVHTCSILPWNAFYVQGDIPARLPTEEDDITGKQTHTNYHGTVNVV